MCWLLTFMASNPTQEWLCCVVWTVSPSQPMRIYFIGYRITTQLLFDCGLLCSSNTLSRTSIGMLLLQSPRCCCPPNCHHDYTIVVKWWAIIQGPPPCWIIWKNRCSICMANTSISPKVVLKTWHWMKTYMRIKWQKIGQHIL